MIFGFDGAVFKKNVGAYVVKTNTFCRVSIAIVISVVCDFVFPWTVSIAIVHRGEYKVLQERGRGAEIGRAHV